MINKKIKSVDRYTSERAVMPDALATIPTKVGDLVTMCIAKISVIGDSVFM